ncbi:MAG: BNR repeat-containing protein [Clostridiales bacterium]|nr:BNR repeat-containing protein [Clostridiales bacterium]
MVNYGRASDTIYSGTWYELEKDADPDTTETAFNTSVSCSTLTLGLATGHVNTMSYRADALATYVDDDGNETQYCAYYGAYDEIVVAKRENGGDWTYRWTGMVGDSSDGHNTIAIAVDGNNCLHMAWSLHAGALTYAKAETPGSLDLEEQSMVGNKEDRVTYPSFYTLPDGDIFFLYRTGVSGDGDAVLNKYDADTGEWSRVQDCLISGEGEVSPYWQACVDSQGRLHISWVWRDTGTTETNHNMCYAVSTDSSGETFQMSSGSTYTLPITEQTAEVLEEIPQGSTLINQTSMTTDENDMPYILSYWRVGGSYGDDSAVVQYMVLRYTGSEWVTCNTGIRSTDFRLDGTGQTGKLCSRPQVAVSGSGDDAMVYILMHDTERDNKLAVASLSIDGDGLALQDITDITYSSIDGGFEPLYDVSLWKQTGKLQLFFQEGRSRSEVSENGYLTEMVYVVDISNLLTN